MNARSHLALFAFAWGSLARRPGRAISLVGGLSTTVALLAAVLFATSSLRREAERAREGEPDLVVQRLSGGRPALIDPGELAFLTELPGVRRARPRVWGYLFLPSLRANVTVIGRADEFRGGDLGAVRGVIAQGRDARKGEPHAVVLGESLARVLRVSPNDVIELPSPHADAPTLTVVGTFGSPVAVYTSDVVLANESDARGILDLPPDRATDVAIDLTSPEEASIVSRAIVAHDASLRIIDQQVSARTSRVTYGRRAGIVLAASLPALVCMLILAWDRLGGLGPSERREIAVQKAVGWSTADVLYAKLYESVLVGVFACGTGIVVAYAWVFGGSAWVLREILAGWGVLYPTVPLTPAIDPADLLGLVTMVFFPFVGVALAPAWRASILDPLHAMRG